jgi:ABC-type Fe3+-hydroxamate transport system substrate-binding protein
LLKERNYKDQMGNELRLSALPSRIISLVPSQTELLFDLGLENEVVGITKFCIHPKDKVNHVSRIGGTKKFDFDKIDQLKPDLIIGNKEENYKEGIEKLQKKFPVWMSDINDLYEALFMIQSIGEITGRDEKAYEIAFEIKKNMLSYKASVKKKALYLIWKDPFMTVGNDTFINEMLKIAGFENIFNDQFRYPVINEEVIRKAAPEIILLSSEPYPFTEKHIDEFRQLCPNANVILVDGEMFSWYGSRLRLATNYFKELEVKLLT